MRQVDRPWVPTGIGKKVDPATAEKDPWVPGSTPGTYRNTQTGKTETRIPGNEAANGYNPIPEPEPVGVFDPEFFRRHGLILKDLSGEITFVDGWD